MLFSQLGRRYPPIKEQPQKEFSGLHAVGTHHLCLTQEPFRTGGCWGAYDKGSWHGALRIPELMVQVGRI